jgi:hypothetical protein
MVHNAQNCWVFGLCPSSRIPETREHNVSETGSVSILRWEGDTLLGPVEGTNLNHNRVGVYPFIWGQKQIQFLKRCF